MFQIPTDIDDSPRRLTQAVLQAAELLGLYNAELARILQLLCGDIGKLAAGRTTLQPATPAWQQAALFVELYRGLYDKYDGDGAAMCHWLHARHPTLQETPLLMIVDHGKLEKVLSDIRSSD